MEIISKQEAIARGLRKFFTGIPCKRGHVGERTVLKHMCVDCQKIGSKKHAEANAEKLSLQKAEWRRANKEKVAAYNREYLAQNREIINAQHARYRIENPERVRQWMMRCRHSPEGKAKRALEWVSYRDRFKEKIDARRAAYYKRISETDRSRINFIAAKRRADRRRATPLWANMEEIRKIYAIASERGEEVDHIIPIKNKIVCGLHVESNLRVIPLRENRRKSNKFDPDDHYIVFN